MTENPSKNNIAVKWSIKWKLMSIMTALIISFVVILMYMQISSQKAALEKQLNTEINLRRENLIERGKSYIFNLTKQVENDIASHDYSGFEKSIKDAVKNNKVIKYAILQESSGKVFIHTLQPHSERTERNTAERDQKALTQTELTVMGEFKEDNESVIEIVHPIQISTNPWGILRLVYTMKYLETEIENSKTQIQEQLFRMIIKSISTSLIFMGVFFQIVFFISIKISKPIIQLTHSAKSLSKHDFSVSDDIQVHSHDEIGVLAATFVEMSQELKDFYEHLDKKVLEKTEEINKNIQYAKKIQKALLPNLDTVKTYLPKSFFIWKPRDIIGGDIFFTDFFENGFIIAVIDCTGHGVPGAFMTMLASSTLQRIIHDEGCHDPAEILKQMNLIVKTQLKQDTEQTPSDDGLDAAVCFADTKQKILTFAGANLPLYYVHNGKVNTIKGDTQSIGYKRSDTRFNFTNNKLTTEEQGMCFYLSTDGFTSQLGGERKRRFNPAQLINLLEKNHMKPFEKQGELLLQAFKDYKGENKQTDDVAVTGFSFDT
ncbi:MAG: SpoIIE family protein phosphatase [Desulfobacterales bacterium]|nr:SpoIIE family protein phosphatase [Desulfobacterales bacterium]